MEGNQFHFPCFQGFSEARFELKQKEQIVRQLNKHLTQLEMDNKELLDNVRDAENTLRSTARDRDVLQLYVKNIEDALEKVSSFVKLFLQNRAKLGCSKYDFH
jgi:predicted transcriptional regulator